MELEPVRDARWDDDHLWDVAGKVEFSGEAARRGMGPDVAEADRGTTVDECPVVEVAEVDVDAPHRLGRGPDEVPLDGARPEPPRLPEHLREAATPVPVWNEWSPLHALHGVTHPSTIPLRCLGAKHWVVDDIKRAKA